MIDVFTVAEHFVDLVRRTAPDDVALIVYYGSYATGGATAQSDLDLYYIPDEGKGGELYRSIVVQGRPFEFWGVSWNFAERIASGKHHWSVAPSIIANARILYARSPEDRQRFEALQAEIEARLQPDKKTDMIKLAQDAFQQTASPRYALEIAIQKGDLIGTRWKSAQLIDAIMDTLALLNQTFFRKNWASDPTQIDALTIAPDGLRERVERLFTMTNLDTVLALAQALVLETRTLVVEAESIMHEQGNPAEVFKSYYPAVQEYVNKIVTACERGNWINANVVSAQMLREVAFMLAYAEDGLPYSEFNVFSEYRATFDRFDFPDLGEALASGDLDQIAQSARAFDRAFRDYLTAHDIALNIADDLASLRTLVG